MPAVGSVTLEVVPAAFDHEADAPTVINTLCAMSLEALVAEVRSTASKYTAADRTSSSLFKRLSLLFCFLKKRDPNFKPWVMFGDVLSHGAISNASVATPVAQAFLAGKIALEDWKRLSFSDVLELRKVHAKLGEELGLAASLRLREPLFSAPYLAELCKTPDPEKWAKLAIKHELSAGDIAASAAAGKIVRHAAKIGRIGFISVRRIAYLFSRWLAEQDDIGHWDRKRCKAVLDVLGEIAAFVEKVRARLAKL